MAVETDVERAIFLEVDDFGSSATYTPLSGSPSTISGLFDNEYLAVDAGGSVPVAMQQPMFTCLTSAVSSAQEGDTLLISTTTYKVTNVQPDGQGMTVLMLQEQ
jgi:hypothetical protein